jgi:RND family efflux transporter MFP subunit
MKKKVLFLVGLAVILAGAGVAFYIWHQGADTLRSRAGQVFRRNKRTTSSVRVEVVHPVRQGIDRTTVQLGTVQAYESAELFSEVSGYLKKLNVDIGSRVQAGDVLAEVDVPELVKQQAKARALVKQAEARVGLARASVTRAEAEYEVAKAAVPQAKETLHAASARRRYSKKRYDRMVRLANTGAVEQYLVDEWEERYAAADATESSAKLGVHTALAQEKAAKAKIAQANADLAEADAEVIVAQAEADRVGVLVGLATIRSPYTGVITKRNLFPGGFVRSAKEGERMPLLAVDRTDKLRVVVPVPDRDVPYADKDDPVEIEFDALGGKKFQGKLARTQGAEDPLTRTMRVEVDLDNAKGELRAGMFAKVTILLAKGGSGLTIPSACLVGGAREGQSSVYVVQGGKAVLKPIRTGLDNGVRVEVLSGLTERDQVVRRYSGSLGAGTPVEVSEPSAAATNGN